MISTLLASAGIYTPFVNLVSVTRYKSHKPKTSAARIFEEFQSEITAFRQLEQKAAEFFKNLSQFTK